MILNHDLLPDALKCQIESKRQDKANITINYYSCDLVERVEKDSTQIIQGNIDSSLQVKKGKIYFSNGNYYEGEIQNFQMHGIGSFQQNHPKIHYQGQFYKGKKQGKGKLIYDNQNPVYVKTYNDLIVNRISIVEYFASNQKLNIILIGFIVLLLSILIQIPLNSQIKESRNDQVGFKNTITIDQLKSQAFQNSFDDLQIGLETLMINENKNIFAKIIQNNQSYSGYLSQYDNTTNQKEKIEIIEIFRQNNSDSQIFSDQNFIYIGKTDQYLNKNDDKAVLKFNNYVIIGPINQNQVQLDTTYIIKYNNSEIYRGKINNKYEKHDTQGELELQYFSLKGHFENNKLKEKSQFSIILKNSNKIIIGVVQNLNEDLDSMNVYVQLKNATYEGSFYNLKNSIIASINNQIEIFPDSLQGVQINIIFQDYSKFKGDISQWVFTNRIVISQYKQVQVFNDNQNVLEISHSDNATKIIKHIRITNLDVLQLMYVDKQQTIQILQQFQMITKLEIMDSFLKDLSFLNEINLPNLKYLSVVNSKLEQLDAKILNEYKNLKTLDFTGNEIEFLDSFRVISLPNLIFLNLSQNKIYNLKFYKQIDLPKLETLILSWNQLNSIEKLGYFLNENLKTLKLEYNLIQSLQDETINKMSFPNLRYIYLSGNQLKDIDPLLKWNCSSLEKVVVFENKILRNKYNNIKFNLIYDK